VRGWTYIAKAETQCLAAIIIIVCTPLPWLRWLAENQYQMYFLESFYYCFRIYPIDKKPWFAVEAKINDINASPHLYYFKDKLRILFSYQVVKQKESTVSSMV
jgi:hypothetical protein